MRFYVIVISAYMFHRVAGSVAGSQDSDFISILPLYGLDNWKECRQRGDFYCIVDADLVGGDSKILRQIKDYSNQTLKHYNRSQIHRGVCVTHSNNTDAASNIWDFAQFYVNQSLNKYRLEAVVQSVAWCSRVEEQTAASPQARALAVLCTALVAFACLATALHVLGDSCVNADGNKYLLAFSLKSNWYILKSERIKRNSHERMKDVACIEGIRFIMMQCVIFAHTIFIYMHSFIDNPEYVEKLYDQFEWKVVLSTQLWLQAFLSISGFLTAYAILLNYDRNPITIHYCFKLLLKRWLRLTPMALLAVWFTIAWFPLVGCGPQWEWLVTREAADCSESWWYHALYIQNYLPAGNLCMWHTWYLGVDMQLHVLGVFLMAFLMRYPKVVTPVLLGLMLGSGFAAGFVLYWYQLAPMITAFSPEALRTIFAGSRVLTLLYLPFWMNLPGYVAGVATAFVLHNNIQNGVKVYETKWFNIIFHCSLPLGCCVVFGSTAFLSDSLPPTWVSVMYSALDRITIAVCFNLFLLGCFSRCNFVLKNFLEKRCFHILGRLSYCVFLIHFIVLRMTMAEDSHLGHATILSMITLLITTSVLSYTVAVPLYLLVELPALQLLTALTGNSNVPRHTRTVTDPPQSDTKTFDLVAHLRTRHEFC